MLILWHTTCLCCINGTFGVLQCMYMHIIVGKLSMILSNDHSVSVLLVN